MSYIYRYIISKFYQVSIDIKLIQLLKIKSFNKIDIAFYLLKVFKPPKLVKMTSILNS